MGIRVLVIGGTGFVGSHVVAACVDRGHDVTVFSRGRRPVVSGVASIVGDRRRPGPATRADLESSWDTVIDMCAHTASDMDVSQNIPATRYLLLSTCGVYQAAGLSRIADESVPVNSNGVARGKVQCERRAALLPAQSLVVRLGVVTGPGYPSGRATYWLDRALLGTSVLVPARPDQPVQLVDVRDVAGFLAAMVDSEQTGVVNVAGPITLFAEFIDLIRAAGHSESQFHWAPEQFVLARGVLPWQEVPLWLPTDHPFRAHLRTGTDRATHMGFVARPLAATIADLTSWYRTHRYRHPHWLALDREQALLRAIRGL
ncbi:NAD-dependent epimerase/dehydratase family protein [Actinoplanes flavus]|uniref:NAD-dependent epimerase/dehydratase family protein n=1 Tax=Actinoplanes flavus TaxID=2820290 RepID=A0ABS3USS5_9ACTN|nr:NAD-dependent epimerase/dehydratase family protein [Actinoplanes flavus]MBO3741635.1 NAD-dependent epimerase/dehydratase family protein [Actinoplanes flavus]